MKKFMYSVFLSGVLVLLLPTIVNAQSSSGKYFAFIEQDLVDSSNGKKYLDVKLSIESYTNGSEFVMGPSTFEIKLNTNALVRSSAKIIDYGLFSSSSNSSHYFNPDLTNTGSPTNIISVGVSPKPSQNDLSGMPIVNSTPKLISTIRILISDVTQNSDVNWSSTTVVDEIIYTKSRGRIFETIQGARSSSTIMPLPVELISFSANTNGENTNILNWATASEKNNSHFDVEYSTDGREWISAGIVEGNGTSTDRHNYSFTHYNNNSGTVYYRLRQVDYNGEFEYSPVRTVSVDGESSYSAVNISPNPATDRAEITVRGYSGRFTATFFNSLGMQTDNFQGSSNRLVVPVSSMRGGVYIVRITSATGDVLDTQRLVVQ